MGFAEISLASKNGLRNVIFGNDLIYPRILDSEFLPNVGAGVKVGDGLSFFLDGSFFWRFGLP